MGRKVLTGCIAILILITLSVLLAPVGSHRGPARRAHCRHQLQQIGLAMRAYHTDHGTFPPAFIADSEGRPMHSWRVLLLPYLGDQKLYDQYRFDEPWDSEHNATLFPQTGSLQGASFACPADSNFELKERTNFVAVVGPETAMPGTGSRRLKEIEQRSDTIFIVEVRDSTIRCLEPRDLNFDEMTFGINDPSGKGIGSYHSDFGDYWSNIGLRKPVWITHVLMVDGTVRDLPESTSPREVHKLLLVNKVQAKGN